jgi:hypothetical protein
MDPHSLLNNNSVDHPHAQLLSLDVRSSPLEQVCREDTGHRVHVFDEFWWWSTIPQQGRYWIV